MVNLDASSKSPNGLCSAMFPLLFNLQDSRLKFLKSVFDVHVFWPTLFQSFCLKLSRVSLHCFASIGNDSISCLVYESAMAWLQSLITTNHAFLNKSLTTCSVWQKRAWQVHASMNLIIFVALVSVIHILSICFTLVTTKQKLLDFIH